MVDPRGEVLASSAKGTGGRQGGLSAAAGRRHHGPAARSESGKDIPGNDVLTTVSAVPRIGWHVFFEQPTAQALTPIRDQLVRIALLIGLGLVIAIIAGTIMARRMLVPITALHAGARRLGAGDFGHRIEVKTSDELEELADQFNGMATSSRDLFRPRREGEGADAGSGAVDQRAQGARGSRPGGCLLARPQRRAADGRRTRARNHPCRCRADLRLRRRERHFDLTKSIGIDKSPKAATSPSTPTNRRSARRRRAAQLGPPTRLQHRAPELVAPRDVGHVRDRERAGRHHDEPGDEPVALVGLDDPRALLVVERRRGDTRCSAGCRAAGRSGRRRG